MAKKQKFMEKVEPEVVEGFVERNTETPEIGNATRITLHTTAEGGIDWEKTKPGTGDLLMQTISNDAIMLEKIASCPDFQEEAGELGWGSEDGGLLLDLLAKAEGLLVSRLSKQLLGMKIDAGVALTSFSLDEEEHTRQDPLMAKVMDQFLTIDPKWRALTMLATAHSASLVRNIRDVSKLQMIKNGRIPGVSTEDTPITNSGTE